MLACFEEGESFIGRCDFTDEDGVERVFDPGANTGEGGFVVDVRGRHVRDWLLNEEDYLVKFKMSRTS